MSPEQALGDLDRIGPASDVYSLGATLHCLLTGKPPFGGDELGAVLRAVQRGNFPTPRTLHPSLDRALEAVCLRAMAVKPNDRYATPRRSPTTSLEYPEFRRLLSDDYHALAQVERASGRKTEAVAAARACRSLWPTDPGELYQVARDMAACLVVGGSGGACG
jgi:serine/threonine protein kinase